MKQITRYSIAIATLLLMSMGAWAAGGFTVNYQLDGESTTATVGEVTYSNGTITVTPADGYYLTAEDLKVIKTIDGQYGQTRTDPSIDATVAITATDANADPSGVTTYTFTVTDEKYDYEITANFHSRKDVAEALIALPEDVVFVYSGEAIEPAVSVTYAGEAMTADKDYTVEYANNINVGSGDITITGIGIYKGTKTEHFDITKGSATLKFSAGTATATMGTTFVAPTLTVTPEGLVPIEYESTNTEVATVDKNTGAVTLVAAGEVTIKAVFVGNENYEAAEAGYTLTVNRAQSEGYGLWINDIQVTEDNYFDVLSNSTDKKSGTIVFNPETNTLVMTNDVSNVEIESRLESLTLHINDVNKVKSIRFNNLGDATKTGKLTITTNGNFPGQIIITNDAGVSAISGFSELTRNMGLQFLEPELVELKNGVLYKYDWKLEDPANPESKKVKDDTTEKLCDAVTIGAVITPLTRNVTVTLTKASDFVAKDANNNPILDENGNPKPASMMNFALNKDILFTIWSELDERNFINGVDGDWQDAGLDDSDGDPGIAVVKTMKDEDVKKIATAVLASEYLPGGTTYSMEFDGITFIVPAGSGEIDVWVKTDPGYVYKLLPVGLKETLTLDYSSSTIKEYQELGNGKVKVTVEYNNLPTQTYYMLYLAEKSANGTRGGTRLGKRDKAHGKLYSVGVRPRSITEVNPPSEASDGVINVGEDPKGVIDTPTPPTAIKTVASESSANSGKWFTADGRQLEGKPTKPGFYIRNGKKIVIK